MPLKLKDLQEEEIRLRELIKRAQEALEAVYKLMAIREVDNISKTETIIPIRRLSVKKAVEAVHRELATRWFTGTEIEEEIIRRDSEKAKLPSLRANIGNAQRNLYSEGFLVRKDIGKESQKVYSYRFKGHETEDNVK
jgi:hypothetical protein